MDSKLISGISRFLLFLPKLKKKKKTWTRPKLNFLNTLTDFKPLNQIGTEIKNQMHMTNLNNFNKDLTKTISADSADPYLIVFKLDNNPTMTRVVTDNNILKRYM